MIGEAFPEFFTDSNLKTNLRQVFLFLTGVIPFHRIREIFQGVERMIGIVIWKNFFTDFHAGFTGFQFLQDG